MPYGRPQGSRQRWSHLGRTWSPSEVPSDRLKLCLCLYLMSSRLPLTLLYAANRHRICDRYISERVSDGGHVKHRQSGWPGRKRGLPSIHVRCQETSHSRSYFSSCDEDHAEPRRAQGFTHRRYTQKCTKLAEAVTARSVILSCATSGSACRKVVRPGASRRGRRGPSVTKRYNREQAYALHDIDRRRLAGRWPSLPTRDW